MPTAKKARMNKTLNLLCAGAAKGLVQALREPFKAQTGADIAGQFGAVGAMRQALLDGAACDLMVVTDAMLHSLAAAGALVAASITPLGRVRTGVAVPLGTPLPDLATPQALKAALLASAGIYFPDPERATAGIHFAKVLRELGIFDALAPRLHTFPNGATAMRAMADVGQPGLIGCTQVSEILYTEGVMLVGVLPPQFELATLYGAAVATGASQAELAQALLALMSGPASATLRAAGGFDE